MKAAVEEGNPTDRSDKERSLFVEVAGHIGHEIEVAQMEGLEGRSCIVSCSTALSFGIGRSFGMRESFVDTESAGMPQSTCHCKRSRKPTAVDLLALDMPRGYKVESSFSLGL